MFNHESCLAKELVSSLVCLAVLIALRAPSHAMQRAEAASSVQSVPAARPASNTRRDFGVFPICTPVRRAGRYVVATGEWFQAESVPSAFVQPEMVIYDNTCPSSYNGFVHQFWFSSGQGLSVTDEGRVPSTTSPTIPSSSISAGFDSAAGCLDAYTISSFEIGYCTDQPNFDARIDFQDSYSLCAQPTPQHSFVLSGLPAAATPGSLSCWTVEIDLSGMPSAFVLPADGDGVFVGTELDNLFGWSFTVLSPVQSGGRAGPLISGDFLNHTGTDGTRWDFDPSSPAPIWPANATAGPGGGAELGTGMSTLAWIRLDGPSYNGCGSMTVPFLSLYLQLHSSDTCPPPPLGTPFCFGDGSSAMVCPCGNNGSAGHGCQNSVASGGGRLLATGTPVLDDVVLSATGELPVATSIFLQGSQQLPSAVPFGDGLRCTAGLLKRLFVHAAQSGAVSAPQAGDASITQRSAQLGDPIAPGTQRFYQVYYRDPSPSFCPAPTGGTYNVTNALAIQW